MKPVYMCEYCDKMGDQITIEEHEQECIHNPANKTCCSCKHAKVYKYWDNCTCTKNIKGDRYVLDVKDCWERGTPITIVGM